MSKYISFKSVGLPLRRQISVIMFTFVLISAILIIFVNPYHVNYEEREAILLSQNAKQENIDIQILKEDRKD